ncbi:ben isoform 2-T2 [Cochliomyia hominivorax]
MFDKNMIRPKSNTTTPFHSITTKTPTNSRSTITTIKRSSIWVIVQLCFLLTFYIFPINCDKLQQQQYQQQQQQHSEMPILSSSTSSPSTVHFLRSHNGDKLLHRVTRLTKLDQYALLDHNNNNNNKSSQSVINRDLLQNTANYMASYGLRTRFQPQKFYSKKERSSAATNQNLVSLNLISEPPKDICNGYCNCERKNAFITVTCDYQKNSRLSPIFDKHYKVPNNARVIIIKLAARTQFQLNEGFLNNTTVNRFIVEGNMKEGEQVEINSNAFSENYGPYPEIGFSNVFAIVIRNKAFQQKGPASYKFNITNSNDVLLLENAFEKTNIRGQFVAIKDLRINEKAFKSAQARLHIESSNIDNIFRFEASMQEIKFVNCTIGTINPGAFDVYDIKLLTFESCRIDAIKSRAITEKFYSEAVSITGASIGLIESDAIFGSGINELKIANNKIDTIYDNAIHVISAFVTITGNKVKHLGNNWLHVEKWSKFVVENNQFGVFGRMLLDNEQNSTSCSFEGNSLTEPQDGSLNFTKPYCRIREVSVNLPCRCDLKWVEKLTDKDLRSEIYCTIDDKLGNCFNATTFNFMKYLNEVCDESKVVLDCVANQNLKKIEGRFYTAEELERKQQQHLPRLIMILAVTILLLIVLIAVIICHIRRRNAQHRGDDAGHRNHIHEFSAEDRSIIDQTLQLIQKKYHEIYKKVYDRVQILYTPDLSEEKCVKTTSQIVNLLNKVKNPGMDFMLFNRVLTEHLQSPLPSAPPADQTPIYSEPSLTDQGFYTSTTFSQMEGSTGGAGTGPEHIYAEPSCAQQPLLPNEYASPADGHLTSMDLYTEPINERETNLTTAPYAVTGSIARTYQSPYRPLQYATPMRNQQQQHHINHIQQRQLPDVLAQHHNNPTSPSSSSSSASTSGATLSNVRKIAQDLQEKTNFNPVAKPRNLHLVQPPTYTAPDKRHKQLLNKNLNSSGDNIEMDMRGAAALPPNRTTTTDAGSNHSGGSDETVQIDDVIEYVDS